MGAIAPIAISAAGSAAGAEVGNIATGGGSQYDPMGANTPQFVQNMNKLLQQALTGSVQQNTAYTNKAINQQNTSLGTANAALSSGLANATTAATQTSGQGLGTQAGLLAPYNLAGYNALDAYQGTLGLSTPTMGSAALAQNLQSASQAQNIFNQYGNLQAPTAPTLQAAVAAGSISPTQVKQYIQSHIGQNQALGTNEHPNNPLAYTGVGAMPNMGKYDVGSNTSQFLNNPAIQKAVTNYLTNQQNQGINTANTAAQTQYNGLLNTYNTNSAAANQAINATGITPQALQIAQAYKQGLFH